MVGHTDHRFVRGQLRQRAGIDAIDFKKNDGGLHTCALIAVRRDAADPNSRLSLPLYASAGVGARVER